jgi:hypothetical protein
MYAWFGINALLVASGVFPFVVQSTCRVKTVNNPVVASLIMDSSAVIDADETGLCNATDIGLGHGNAKLVVLLEVGDYTYLSENYKHPMLVPKEVSSL